MKFQERYNQAIGPAHFLANMVHPSYLGAKLTDGEKEKALAFASDKYPEELGFPALVIKLQLKGEPFKSYMFKGSLISDLKPTDWWRAQENVIGIDIITIVLQLLTSCSSSASTERIFSSFGLVQSKLRNHLGNEKAGKLVTFLYRRMNQ